MGPGGRLRAGLRFSRSMIALSRAVFAGAAPRARRAGAAAPLDRAETTAPRLPERCGVTGKLWDGPARRSRRRADAADRRAGAPGRCLVRGRLRREHGARPLSSDERRRRDSRICARSMRVRCVPHVEADHYVDEESIRVAVRHESSFNLVHYGTGLKIDAFVCRRLRIRSRRGAPDAYPNRSAMPGVSVVSGSPRPKTRFLRSSRGIGEEAAYRNGSGGTSGESSSCAARSSTWSIFGGGRRCSESAICSRRRSWSLEGASNEPHCHPPSLAKPHDERGHGPGCRRVAGDLPRGRYRRRPAFRSGDA